MRNASDVQMETVKVEIRELRDHLASYLLQSDASMAITRHGERWDILCDDRGMRPFHGKN